MVLIVLLLIIIYRLLVGSCLNEIRGSDGITGGNAGKHMGDSGIRAGTQHTYIIAGKTGIEEMTAIMNGLPGWRRIYKGDYADFIFGITSLPRELYHTKARLKCRFNSSAMSDKASLHEHLSLLAPDTIAPTFIVDESSVVKDKPLMVRANWAYKGMANGVATTTAELQQLWREFREPKLSKQGLIPRVIASEYITDPMLYNGHKFHLRTHIVVTLLERLRAAYLVLPIEIITSEKPYVAGEYGDKRIHDTHFTHAAYKEHTVDRLPSGEKLQTDIIQMLTKAMIALLPLFKQYDEAQNSYELFGVDMMVYSDGTPVIIEVNYLPGLTGDGIVKTERKNVLNCIYQHAVVPVFGGASVADDSCIKLAEIDEKNN